MGTWAGAQAVSQFGTDFEMIAALFPSRRRREIVNKFNKEDRKNPAFITQLIYKRKRVGASTPLMSRADSQEAPFPASRVVKLIVE